MKSNQLSLLSLCILVPLLLAGCARNGTMPGDAGVIVDTRDMDLAQYQQDLAECQAFADQVPVAERAATGAVVGAVIGGAIGAVLGDGEGAERGAGTGAISGGVRGTASGLSERDQVIKRCLQGRGYRVLN